MIGIDEYFKIYSGILIDRLSYKYLKYNGMFIYCVYILFRKMIGFWFL